MKHATLHWLGGITAVGMIAALYACSATDNSGNTFGSSGSGGTSPGKGGSGGGDASTLPNDGSPNDTGLLFETSLGDGTITADSACAATVVEAEVLPLDLYIMADRSGSMTTDNRWGNQSSALNAFFNDPQSAGLFIALRFFPLDDYCSPQDGSCSGDAYANPLVPWGELPAHASTLSQAIYATTANGCFTPTQEAINGVLKGAYARQVAEPQHVVAAVIVSDGEPCCGECEESPSALGAIASHYANGTPPIKTFAIYVADDASDVMTAIAHDGGTGVAYDATGGQQAFITALNDIRGSLLACEYKMPVAEAGIVNPELIQVEFTPGGATEGEEINRVDDAGQCAGGDGWYYDDNTSPTKIIMCPTTCDKLQNDENGRVDILVGCSNIQR